MKETMHRLETEVVCLEEIRLLLQAWRRFMKSDGLWRTCTSRVEVAIDDWAPGEEIILGFTARRSILERFLSRLTAEGVRYECREVIPTMLTKCQLLRDRRV